MRSIRDLFFGITLPFRALGIVAKRLDLLLMSLGPLLVAFGVLSAVYAGLFEEKKAELVHGTYGWLQSHFGPSLGWLSGALSWMLSLTAEVAFWLVAVFTFSTVANLLALPINDFLAERTERYTDPPIALTTRQGWGHFLRGLLIDLGKGLLAALGLILCLVLAFVPGLNLIGLLLSWLLLSFQYVSYCHTRRGIGTGEAVRFLGRNFAMSLGFGASCAVLLTIPFVALFVPPLGVVGGTVLCARAFARDPSSARGNPSHAAV